MTRRPLPLFTPDGATDAGLAIGEDFHLTIAPIVGDLLDAGYDPAHVEVVMQRAVSWSLTLAKILRQTRTPSA